MIAPQHALSFAVDHVNDSPVHGKQGARLIDLSVDGCRKGGEADVKRQRAALKAVVKAWCAWKDS